MDRYEDLTAAEKAAIGRCVVIDAERRKRERWAVELPTYAPEPEER